MTDSINTRQFCQCGQCDTCRDDVECLEKGCVCCSNMHERFKGSRCFMNKTEVLL